MNFHEYQAKELFAEYGIPVPPGKVASTAEQAVDGWQVLRVQTEEGRDLSGWWRQYGEFLLTVVTGRPVPPPQALTDPPGLAIAHPSHSWLAAPLADRPGEWLPDPGKA